MTLKATKKLLASQGKRAKTNLAKTKSISKTKQGVDTANKMKSKIAKSKAKEEDDISVASEDSLD